MRKSLDMQSFQQVGSVEISLDVLMSRRVRFRIVRKLPRVVHQEPLEK